MNTEILPLKNENQPNIIPHFSDSIIELAYSKLTISFIVPILIILAYIIGKRTIQKDVIIDQSLRDRLENVELTRKTLNKKIRFWEDIINFIKSLFYLVITIFIVYAALFYLNKEFIDFLMPYFTKNVIHIIILTVVFLYIIYKYANYKKSQCITNLNEIDSENKEISSRIVGKMGPELTKLLTNTLIQQKQENRFKKECKKPLCELTRQLLQTDLNRYQTFMRKIDNIEWCSYCANSNYIEKANKSEKFIENTLKTDSDMQNTIEPREIQTLPDEIEMKMATKGCQNNCGANFWKCAKEIGFEFMEKEKEIIMIRKKINELKEFMLKK